MKKIIFSVVTFSYIYFLCLLLPCLKKIIFYLFLLNSLIKILRYNKLKMKTFCALAHKLREFENRRKKYPTTMIFDEIEPHICFEIARLCF